MTLRRTQADTAHQAEHENHAEHESHEIDPQNAKVRLALVKHLPFFVFHDAFQYFEKRFGLAADAALTPTPESRPGAMRLSYIRRRIQELGSVCVFSEPEFQPKLINVLTEGTQARMAILAPLGTELPSGLLLYSEMMWENAKILADCLAKN